MNTFKSFALMAGVATAALTGFTAASYADELVLSSWLPPKHPIVVGVMEPWAEQVSEATDGRVTVRILPKPLGPPPAHYDLAADGVADITYGLHSFTKDDRFLRSRIGQFSFLGDTATDGSKAYWSVYGGTLDAQAEHQGTKLLGLWVHGPGMFHNNQRKIEALEDFGGLKIRTPGGYIADLSQDVGITTQFMGPGEVFEKLSRGVIDGVTFPVEALQAFNLTDHIKYSMKVPGGIYNTSWFLVMNEDIWDGISEEDQAAIEAVSGEALAELAGGVWDAADARGADYIADKDIEVYDAPTPVLDAIRELAAKHEAAWADAVQETGFDGAGALAEFRAQTGVSN
ncbi:TRAP transporter substrate-binding protein [Roseibium denhamense]|uniref:TRAP-type C4-dicarboxylate transport system, substrate-binding protein n=1 Tax=Roseibium denhamense TaxID=76305 RepID=A0ABY1N8G1_9HYPH|nr:TRAP transporter substrate-binding protein [Roseibium denhamense]SMP03294.1 TRAP-type C4-dicarboxylate transport system, substrate-binding protein [Roseibium denhamense]